MSKGSGAEATHAETDARELAEGDPQTAPVSSPSTGTLKLRSLFSNGLPDADAVAQVVMAHPGEHHAMFSFLHSSVGNAYVQSVLGAVGRVASAPIQLNPSAPLAPQSPLPLANEADLKARADRITAEGLLKSQDLNAGDQAAKAMEILVDVPPDHRGKVIDDLDDKAFENLLERVPDDQRERFAALVESSRKPERKLRLWAEFHKSRADNDLRSRKGDVGKDVPTHPGKDEDGNAVEEEDEDERETIEASWTKEQKLNRIRDSRRRAAVDSTKGEVDLETERLMKKAKTGSLTLADVDAMRERKDLEYQIELENNVNLTADTGPGRTGDGVNWSKSELELLRTTLARLPQAHDPNGFSEIHRAPTMNFMEAKGGVHSGHEIDITDWGTSSGAGFSHGGDERELVSDEFRREHGDRINILEYVLTHEIGHDVADRSPAAFKKFQKAAGWETVKADALRKDHISDKDVKTLEGRRDNPNAATSDIGSDIRTYSPIQGSKDEYWANDRTAIPNAQESAPNSTGGDSWQYSRVDPAEHFAETYAKAVHVPEKLHDELVDRPVAAARDARARLDQLNGEITELKAQPSAPNAAERLAAMTTRLSALESDAATKARAEKQRGDEFLIMRNDVFGTDKAVVVATQRLQAKKVSPDKIAEFQRRAEHASTPEQVGVLEGEVTR
jgi:hypothetical protein